MLCNKNGDNFVQYVAKAKLLIKKIIHNLIISFEIWFHKMHTLTLSHPQPNIYCTETPHQQLYNTLGYRCIGLSAKTSKVHDNIYK